MRKTRIKSAPTVNSDLWPPKKVTKQHVIIKIESDFRCITAFHHLLTMGKNPINIIMKSEEKNIIKFEECI